MRRYFEILQIQPNVSWDEVKKAYKKGVRDWHPDRFPENDEELQKKAHEKFHKIQDAYFRLEKIYKSRRNGNDPRGEHTGEASRRENRSGSIHHNDSVIFSRRWSNGDSYEGMCLNGMPHGRGIFTCANGDEYTGEFRFGNMEGQGIFKYAHGDHYTGEFINNMRHGQGKMTFANGDRYMGAFEMDQFHGEGVLMTRKQVYAGQWYYGGLR